MGRSVGFDGAAPELLVAILVALENVLDWAQDSLECASLDTDDLGVGECLDACLPGNVADQCNLTEVVALLVVVDCHWVFV